MRLGVVVAHETNAAFLLGAFQRRSTARASKKTCIISHHVVVPLVVPVMVPMMVFLKVWPARGGRPRALALALA